MGYQEGMDDLEEYPVGVRVLILAAQVKASANLATWLFLGLVAVGSFSGSAV